MRVLCENCGATYNIPDEKVKGRAFRFTCKKCGETVHVRPEKPTNKKTMMMEAADVQPRMSGEMPAFNENAATVFQPSSSGAPRQQQPKQEPKAAAKPEIKPEEKPEIKPEAKTESKPEVVPVQKEEEKKVQETKPQDAPTWYVAQSGQRHGPFDLATARSMVEDLSPKGEVHVWCNGFDGWKAPSDVPEFSEKKETPERAFVGDPAMTPGPAPTDSAKPKVKSRPTFTELVNSELGDDTGVKEPKLTSSGKIDISALMEKEKSAKPVKASVAMPQSALKESVKLQEYVPPTKKKIPWIPLIVLLTLFALVVATPLTLAYKRIIEIPGLDEVPVIGKYFKVEKVDHYAKLREQWEMLVKIDEAKIALKATKEAEEKERLEEEARKAAEEKAARQARAAERRRRYTSRGGSGNGGQKVTELDFGAGPDGTEMETVGELRTNEISRNAPLDQATVNETIKKNMKRIVRCVAEQKKFGDPISGTMSVTFTISRRGTVVRANVASAKFKDSYVGDCVCDKIEKIRFPRSGGTITVSYPFSIQ